VVCNFNTPTVHQSRHRVAVPSAFFQGTNYLLILEAKEGLRIGDVHKIRIHRGEEYWIYEFATQDDAMKFRERLARVVASRLETNAA
jgi:hypothetical protein